ncbi:MAG: hypothetical protein JWM57_1295 [Phycisphaerales bacterium]|nr:hypothetical protein [Phycisphaerales bacterium]
MTHEPPQLDYERSTWTEGCNWRAIVLAAVVGLPTGIALGFAGYAIIVLGPLASILVGSSVAYAARSKRARYAVLSGVVVGVAAFAWPAVRNFRDGFSSISETVTMFVMAVPLFFVMPAATGGIIVAWSRRRAAEPPSAADRPQRRGY